MLESFLQTETLIHGTSEQLQYHDCMTMADLNISNSSVSKTVQQRYESKLVYFLSFVDDVTALYTSIFYPGWKLMFENDFERNGRRVYREHYDQVRTQAREGNHELLEYQVGDGWESLCDYLEMPVPEQSFPTGNEIKSFHEATEDLDRSRMWAVASKAAFLGVGCAVAFMLASRHMSKR